MKQKILLLLLLLLAIYLRLYQLGSNPPSLYWDEASLGYNAFAVLTTGRDEHGDYLPITHFTAFGDYKPPGYIYVTVLSLKIFGVNEFAIRFPSALAGIAMVIVTYLLAKKLTNNEVIALLSALFIAISPWSLQLSRAAFEAHMAAFLNVLGIYLFILALETVWILPLSFVSFIAAFYTFNSNRILSPLFILLLLFLYRNQLMRMKKWVVIAGIVAFILILPTVYYFTSRESRLRFQEVSIFTSLATVEKANDRITRSGSTLLAQILHNRRIYFIQDFLLHYFDNFKGVFLFISGDPNPRLSIQEVGELYLYELPFLMVGLVYILRKRTATSYLLLGWLLIAPIPAGMARETPHMLRIASILPTFHILIAIGLFTTWSYIKKYPNIPRLFLKTSFFIVFIANLIYYQHQYWVHYPYEQSSQWQYGYKQLVLILRELEPQYDRIMVTQEKGRPYIYFLLYNQISPQTYLTTRRAERDWFGLWNVYGFGKYDFTKSARQSNERVLQVATIEENVKFSRKIAEIRALDNSIVFEIGEP